MTILQSQPPVLRYCLLSNTNARDTYYRLLHLHARAWPIPRVIGTCAGESSLIEYSFVYSYFLAAVLLA